MLTGPTCIRLTLAYLLALYDAIPYSAFLPTPHEHVHVSKVINLIHHRSVESEFCLM